MRKSLELNFESIIAFAIFFCGVTCGFATSAHGAAAKSCETIFAAADSPMAVSASKPDLKQQPHSMGIIEPIASIFTGSQLYSVVLGGSGEETASENIPGLYRRDQRSWKILIPGEIMLDQQGAPLLTQLSLAKTDKNSYVVTVIDGNVHLLTGHSDPKFPKSMIQFGTKENPLFERFESQCAGG